MAEPSLDSIKDATEKASASVEWLAEIWHGKNWVKKLLLVDALVFAVFNPASFSFILKLFTTAPLPENYPLYFWPLVGLIFLAALIVAIRIKSKKAPPVFDPGERSAIKGLRPFGFDDAEIFRRLQREDMLAECLNAITDRDFRLGILFGESGCGKTSFLQAGLWPMLPQHSASHQGVYVKFTDLDPFDSIRHALKEQIQFSVEAIAATDLTTLLEKAGQAQNKTLVLFFDQFEQFFVHHPRQEQRQPFIAALAQWHKNGRNVPAKILFCLRHEFLYCMDDLQKAMGYSLGPQDTFHLQKFTPSQATAIFQVIAEAADLDFDRSFVEEMTQEELAQRDDGLISPVDLQILTWVIHAQKTEAKAGFNKTAFQKMGGIEGMLENFLARALAVMTPETQRQAALKVLLALIDLENNVRAGVLSLAQIQEKLAGTVALEEMSASISWLAQSNVRLITPAQRNDQTGYELAHERLIPVVRRLAGQALSQADQANQLLERRVNEWLGNARAGRYLLSWQEMRLLDRQKPYLIWGQRKTQKQELLQQSRRRLWQRAGLASVPLIFILAFLLWWQSPWGQIFWVKKELINLSKKVNDENALKEFATAFALAGDFKYANRIASQITEHYYKSLTFSILTTLAAQMGDFRTAAAFIERASEYAVKLPSFDGGRQLGALSALVAAAEKLDDPTMTLAVLEQAHQITMKISDNLFKARAFFVLTTSAMKIGEIAKALAFQEKGCENIEELSDDLSKAQAFSELACSMARIAEITKDMAFLEAGCQIAEKISDINYKMQAFSVFAISAAKIGDSQKATAFLEQACRSAEEKFDAFSRTKAFFALAASATLIRNTPIAVKFLEQCRQSAEQISDNSNKIQIWLEFAALLVKIGNREIAVKILEQCRQSVEQISYAVDKSNVLSAFAVAAAKIGAPKMAIEFLEQGCQSADKISIDVDKSEALSILAVSALEIGDFNRAAAFLNQARQSAETIPNVDIHKSRILFVFVASTSQIAETTKDVAFLEQGRQIAEKITNEFDKSKAFSTLASSAAKIEKWSLARVLVESNVTDANKAKALAAILTVWAERQHPALAETAVEEE